MAVQYSDLPVIDLAQPDWWREPMVVTAPMHAANAPAAFVPTFGTVFFLRYEDNLSGLNDPNLMAMGARYFEMQGWTEGAFVDWIRLNVVMMNPPGHTRLRKLVSRAFTPRAVASMRDVSQRFAAELCDQVDDNGGQVEFVHEWARVLPLRVVCEMIGIPRVDVNQMEEWALGLTMASGVTTPEAREAGDRGMEGFNEYVSAMIAERRANPRDDLLTALDRRGRRRRPSLAGRARRDGRAVDLRRSRDDAEPARERALPVAREPGPTRAGRAPTARSSRTRSRRCSATTRRSRSRRASRDDPTVIAGIDIAEDQFVMLNLTAANHDPERFPDPARFDVQRPEIRHLSFGWGVHYCLGASLARIEGEVAFETLLDRYGTIEETGESDWTSFTPLRGRQRMDLVMKP